MLNFRDIANKKIEEIERPKNPPVGTYLWQITKIPTIDTLPGDQWDFVDFPVKAIAPTDTVDPDAIQAWGGDVTKITQRLRFLFSKTDPVEQEKSVWRLRNFLENHVKCATADMSITEAMNASMGGQFLGDIKWTQDKKDPEVFHANLERTAPIDA